MDDLSRVIGTKHFLNVATNKVEYCCTSSYKISDYNICVSTREELNSLSKFLSSLDLSKLDNIKTEKKVKALLYEENLHDLNEELKAFVEANKSNPFVLPEVKEYIEEQIWPKILLCLNTSNRYNVDTKNFNAPNTCAKNAKLSRCLTFRRKQGELLYNHLVEMVENRRQELDEIEGEERKHVLSLVKNIEENCYIYFNACEPLSANNVIFTYEIKGKLKRYYTINVCTTSTPEYKVNGDISEEFRLWLKNNTTTFNREKDVEDYLSVILELKVNDINRGRQVNISTGRVDIIYGKALIELKNCSRWREAIGQLRTYKTSLPDKRLLLILFGKCKDLPSVTKVCREINIELYFFEEIYKEVEKAKNKKEKLLWLLSCSPEQEELLTKNWNAELFAECCKRNNIELLEWLLKRGCPFDISCFEALDMNPEVKKVLLWLLQNCPIIQANLYN